MILSGIALGATLVGPGYASERCTDLPKEKWLSETDLRARIESQGFKVERLKRENHCYEVRARNRDGDKVELMVNPADGSISEEEDES